MPKNLVGKLRRTGIGHRRGIQIPAVTHGTGVWQISCQPEKGLFSPWGYSSEGQALLVTSPLGFEGCVLGAPLARAPRSPWG